ncbi:MAG: Fe/S biogenesis protein NfuA [Candidatus Aldehydirespiratoraceae bacterium]|jgi:Fe/S biogenesis protein NfuA
MPENDPDGVLVLSVTDAALAKALKLRADETDAESLGLWVEVNGTSGDAYTYDMYFQAVNEAAPDDWTGVQSELMIVVPSDSVPKLVGSVLDLNSDLQTGGMNIRNPNLPPPSPQASPAMTGPPPDLSGDVAQRVIQVLEHQINPSIAAHGGRADLVAVKDDAAYLRLSGGCAGCGMAAVTLSQGIEVAIKESVPEIVNIVDVTDHAAGTNPYFEPAKK